MSAKQHRQPPFRAEHIGSLRRPEFLLEKRHEVEAGKLSEQELVPYEDKAITEVVQTQLDLGFPAVTDGEFRRISFWGTFFNELDGMVEIQEPPLDMFRLYVPDIASFVDFKLNPGATVVCKGKIKHTGKSTYLPAFEFLKKTVKPEEVGNIKITMAAPNWYHLRYKTGNAFDKNVYSDDSEYFADLAKAYRDELKLLYDAGARNIQFDDPNLAYFCSEKMLAGWKEDKLNTTSSDDMLDSYIKLYNDCMSGAPEDMHFGVHLCRGNFINAHHFSEGGYDRIATKLFTELNTATYYLEYDTPRAGSFEPLKELPAHKNLILGVVSTKLHDVEDKDEIKKKILDAADTMAQGKFESREAALKNLGISPQCGFSTHVEGYPLSNDEMKVKMGVIRKACDELWPGEV